MADFGPGLDLDFLQRIVNVHWAGGLAVEFGDKAQDAPKPATAGPELGE